MEEINVFKKRSMFHSHRSTSCLVASRFAASSDWRGGTRRWSGLCGRHASATTTMAHKRRNAASGRYASTATTVAHECRNAASGRYACTATTVAYECRNAASGRYASTATTVAHECRNAASGRHASAATAVAHECKPDLLVNKKGGRFMRPSPFVLRFATHHPHEVVARIIIIFLAGGYRS
jgi:hypothetical protein